jgi:hypothetical protein
MHSFEKAFFGFIDYNVINIPADTIITIRDYTSTGEAYLIPVPGLDDHYYILENHQQLTPYDEAAGKGLYIFYLKYGTEYSLLNIQTADGKYDWAVENSNPIKKHENPISGTSRLETVKINNISYYPPEMEGNINDPFTMNGNKVYAPWTNPTSNGMPVVQQDHYTNVMIQLLGEKDGELSVLVTTDAYTYYSEIVQVKNISSVNEFKLNQNYPNPFNNSTRISFSLNRGSNVLIKIFDILGSEVKTLVNEFKQEGTYSLDFDGGNMNSGVYFLRMQTDKFTDTKKIILLK